MTAQVFQSMIGRTMRVASGRQGDECLWFESTDGKVFEFQHFQDCCEHVQIEEVVGDMSDLVDSPMLQAEEVSSEGFDDAALLEAREYELESYTWTFYKFATMKGSVTVRFLGTSNGYYGEGVDYMDRDK